MNETFGAPSNLATGPGGPACTYLIDPALPGRQLKIKAADEANALIVRGAKELFPYPVGCRIINVSTSKSDCETQLSRMATFTSNSSFTFF